MYLLTSCSVFSACMGVLAFRGRLSAPSISFMCRLVRDFCWLSPPSPFLTLILWPLVIPLSIAAQQWEGSPPLPLSMKKRPPSSCWLTKSAKEIASAIRSRRITSVEITTLCLRQLEAVNPALNAVVATFAEEALVAAAAADDALQDGSAPGADSTEGALWGVPIIIKECFSVDGKPFTGGVASRRGVIGDHDCAAVRRLRECGLVVLGLANTSEGCMWFESDNPIYGRTSNPFDLRRTAGGSSGGCAAAVSARCCPIAVTSDVGGSTRIPAAFVGLYGHKPTGGAVTNNGTFPAVGNGDIQSTLYAPRTNQRVLSAYISSHMPLTLLHAFGVYFSSHTVRPFVRSLPTYALQGFVNSGLQHTTQRTLCLCCACCSRLSVVKATTSTLAGLLLMHQHGRHNQ